MKGGKPSYTYNFLRLARYIVAGPHALPPVSIIPYPGSPSSSGFCLLTLGEN